MSFVYAAMMDDGRIKVGATCNVKNRMHSLRAAEKMGIVKVYSAPCDGRKRFTVESVAHHLLEATRFKRDWFRAKWDDAVEAVDRAVEMVATNHPAVTDGTIRIVKMGNVQKYSENTTGRFAPGTFERIGAILGATEDRADFIRGAVDTELVKRERKSGGAGVRRDKETGHE